MASNLAWLSAVAAEQLPNLDDAGPVEEILDDVYDPVGEFQ